MIRWFGKKKKIVKSCVQFNYSVFSWVAAELWISCLL